MNKSKPYGVCKTCGEKYYTWSGSMLHHLDCPNKGKNK